MAFDVEGALTFEHRVSGESRLRRRPHPGGARQCRRPGPTRGWPVRYRFEDVGGVQDAEQRQHRLQGRALANADAEPDHRSVLAKVTVPKPLRSQRVMVIRKAPAGFALGVASSALAVFLGEGTVGLSQRIRAVNF
ncbi:hypothetical protein GCM10009727_53490 [Actinomadura napierensis]|uniref:Uncharacterized protein n=1 Tax=Actinomadura napierensis TaxID=267854 RepID=A0ABN2ZXN0_9ACTN